MHIMQPSKHAEQVNWLWTLVLAMMTSTLRHNLTILLQYHAHCYHHYKSILYWVLTFEQLIQTHYSNATRTVLCSHAINFAKTACTVEWSIVQ